MLLFSNTGPDVVVVVVCIADGKIPAVVGLVVGGMMIVVLPVAFLVVTSVVECVAGVVRTVPFFLENRLMFF